jgi:FlaA1/EpsC-like NDP-sugar epimerase
MPLRDARASAARARCGSRHGRGGRTACRPKPRVGAGSPERGDEGRALRRNRWKYVRRIRRDQRTVCPRVSDLSRVPYAAAAHPAAFPDVPYAAAAHPAAFPDALRDANPDTHADVGGSNAHAHADPDTDADVGGSHAHAHADPDTDVGGSHAHANAETGRAHSHADPGPRRRYADADTGPRGRHPDADADRGRRDADPDRRRGDHLPDPWPYRGSRFANPRTGRTAAIDLDRAPGQRERRTPARADLRDARTRRDISHGEFGAQTSVFSVTESTSSLPGIAVRSFYVRRRPWTPSRIGHGIAKHGPTAVADCLAVSLIYLLAVGARIGGPPFAAEAIAGLFLAFTAGIIQVVANVVFDLYWRDWSAAALEDVFAVVKASLGGAIALLVFNFLSEAHPIPNTAILTGAGLVIVAQSGMRLRPRWRQIFRAAVGGATGAQTAIVVGAGRVGRLLAQDLSDDTRGYRIACFVDDDARKWGTYVRGKLVAGSIEDLPQLISAYKPQVVIIAHPAPPGALVRRVLARCNGSDVRVRAVSGFAIRDGDTAPLRAIEVDELLEREPVKLETSLARAYIAGRTVLVTGAVGSIGSEICRRISRLEPKQLVLLDTNESGLHDLVAGLNGASTEMLLGDVRDELWLNHVFADLRPEVIFHSAAYKHVPIIERTPLPGIATNVIGTANVLAAAAAIDVERFVFISTDKAVEPVSVLGVTKRFGELLTIAYARKLSQNYCVVRFGNVLGSAGSVVPIFSRQIDSGGPVTITHPEVTRYFMTIPEAAGLVIEAGAVANPGDLLVLDMGSPVSLVELAEKMIRLRGLRTPADIPIIFTSLRPGERLREQLFFARERAVPTEHPRVLRVAAGVETPALVTLRAVANQVRERLAPEQVAFLIGLLREVVAVSDLPSIPSASAEPSVAVERQAVS